MTYRPITKDEIPVVAEIKARAFRRDVDVYIDALRKGGRVDWRALRLLENKEGQPVAALTAFERRMSLNGGELAAGLVGGVAVPPEQRRRGYGARLMTGLLEELHQCQLPISLLFPFSTAYYARLGYALVNLNWFLDIPPRQLPDYPERMAVRRATPDDHAAICACYERARRQPGHNGWFARTDWEWQNRVWEEEREAVVYPAAGEIEGYLIYTLTWDTEATPVQVAEWVVTSGAAWRGLTGFLAALGEQATVVTYNAPQDSPLPLALSEPYSTVGGSVEFVYRQVARLVSGFMLRVIHLPAALRARRYPPAVKADLLLRVDDPQLPANSQPLHLHIADGAASVVPARSLFPNDPPTSVETDIATFGQILVGFISAEQARALGRLRADDATCAQLTAAFATAPLYLHRSDWF
jgi:predicted acetyltransferase